MGKSVLQVFGHKLNLLCKLQCEPGARCYIKHKIFVIIVHLGTMNIST